MGNSSPKDTYITFSPEAIEAEIKVWESIKTCGFGQKSVLFNKCIDVENVLLQLYKAKKDRKIVEIKTKNFYTYYYSEDERRADEERKRREEEEKRKREEEEKKKKK